MPTSSEALNAELEASLLRELAYRWRSINRHCFRDAMVPPVFGLVDSQSLLGRWHRDSRSMELARSFVMDRPWTEVVEVLKHEMAHQYVHEILQVHDETAHGPAFRQICERHGIDARASGRPEQQGEPQEKRLLAKVRGLLALAQSSNQHEAESAAAMAQRLMLKHNLALANDEARQNYGFRQLGEPSGRVAEHIHLLAGIVAEHYFVEAIWVPAYRPLAAKRGNVLEICGRRENLELADYVWSYLLSTGERLWSEHKRQHGIAKNRDRRSFLAGLMEGFSARLAREREHNQERGLVWVGDPALQRYYRRRHPHVRGVRLRGHGPSQPRQHGRDAGSQIVIRQGVRQGASQQTRALPPKR